MSARSGRASGSAIGTFAMLPFLLYLAAGVATAAHVYVLLSLQMFGVPSNVLEFVSLFASLALTVCAYVSIFRPFVAARVALIAALGAWAFYAPSIAATLGAAIRPELGQIRVFALPSAAVGLLTLATIYSAIVSFRTRKPGVGGSWFFPEGAGQPTRLAIGFGTILVVVGASAWVALGQRSPQKPSARFLIPDGYVGWVRIEFNVPGAPVLSQEKDQYLYTIPEDGVLKTSSRERFGWSNDEYYYSAGSSLRPLRADGGTERMVWGKINGERGGPPNPQEYEEFFVGTEQQFRDMAGTKSGAGSPNSASSGR